MRLEAHVDVARAKLRKTEVVRSCARRLDAGQTFVIVHPLGQQRLWTLSTSTVLEGFTRGLESAASLRGDAKLRAAIGAAREALVARCNAIIERELPDVALLALHLDGGELYAHSIGPCRAYLHRRRRTERITTHDDDPAGMLLRTASESHVSLEPKDLILGGTLSAFTAASVTRVASVLEQDPESSPQIVAQLLTEPAEQAGTGAAVVVARAR